MDRQWHAIPVEILSTRTHIKALSAVAVQVSGEVCTLMKGFDPAGYGLLSIMRVDQPSLERRVQIFEFKHHFRHSPVELTKVRARADNIRA
jgi:hypothetical protein